MTRKLHSGHWATWLLLPFLALIVSCNDDEDGEPPRPEESLVEILSQTEGLDSLITLVELVGRSNTGLPNRLATSEHTIFAPNNDAFIKLLEAIGLSSMSELRSDLSSDILFYHVIPNIAIASNQPDSSAATLGSELLEIRIEGDSVVLNPSQSNTPTVVSADLPANNGVIHVIDDVVLPSSLREVEQYFGSVAGLVSTLPNLGETSLILQIAQCSTYA